MKKSLIALAVLATTGAAFAQSSVTLYGRLDASVGQTTSQTTGAAKTKQTVVGSSALNTTFWGLKGTEDLGNGLKANFKLESNFNVDNGAIGTGSSLFEREATVGVAGAFGEVNLGRQYTPYDSLRGASNNTYDSNFSVTSAVFRTGVKSGPSNPTVNSPDATLGTVDYANRASNSIRYNTPDFAGFSAALLYSFGENKEIGTQTTATATNFGEAADIISAHVKYVAGPLLVGYSHQEEKLNKATALAAQVTNKRDLIAGYYDFGVAKLNAGYNVAKDGTLKDKEYQFGVSVPFGAAAVAFGYAKSSSSAAGQPDLDGKGFDLVGTYNLSKRTTVYAGYRSYEVETLVSGAVSAKKDTTFATGVRHTF